MFELLETFAINDAIMQIAFALFLRSALIFSAPLLQQMTDLTSH